MTTAAVNESFTGTGAGSSMTTTSDFNISIDFTTGLGSGTVALERSFDGGTTWKTVKSYTADAEEVAECPENIQHRLNCTAFTSGTIAGRLSYTNKR